MVDETTELRIRAFAQLDTLGKMLEGGSLVDTDFVADYDRVLDQLESAEEGLDLAQFRLPPGSLKTDPRRKGGTPSVSKPLMYSRLQTLLTYFSIRAEILAQAAVRRESPAKLIGFHAPD